MLHKDHSSPVPGSELQRGMNTATIRISIAAILVIYIPGLFVPLMDYDSSHHAAIALHMHLSGNYAFLIDHGEPYLDKPHLLFWLSAFCYKLFGVTGFTYRFPSFLFSLLAIYSTYRLGKKLYSAKAGELAALILASAFAFAVSVYDVRMEGLLTGAVIFSTWQLICYGQERKIIHLLLAALGLAAGFSTKGMIGLAIPVTAFIIHVIYSGAWKSLFDPRWLLMLFFLGLFISPVVYCYYLQFDLHPETVVKGQPGISGVRFILWDQSFKRMSGESHGVNQSDFFFFFHTFLWAFLPWSILCLYAILARVKSLVRNISGKGAVLTEAMTTGTVIFFLVLFSFSKFKLPHYLNCLFPFFSILLAGYLLEKVQNNKMEKLFLTTQLIVSPVIILLGLLLSAWAFPATTGWKAFLLICLFALWISVFVRKRSGTDKYFLITITAFLFLLTGLFLNFYPQLLKFQAGNQLAFRAREEKIPSEDIFYLEGDIHSPSFDLYSAWLHRSLNPRQIIDSIAVRKPLWVYTSQDGLDSLRSVGIHTGKVFTNPDFRVSVLTFPFINPATRSNAIKRTWLVEVL